MNPTPFPVHTWTRSRLERCCCSCRIRIIPFLFYMYSKRRIQTRMKNGPVVLISSQNWKQLYIIQLTSTLDVCIFRLLLVTVVTEQKQFVINIITMDVSVYDLFRYDITSSLMDKNHIQIHPWPLYILNSQSLYHTLL